MNRLRNRFNSEELLLIAATGLLGFSLAYVRFHTPMIVAVLEGCSALLAIAYAIAQTRKLPQWTPHSGIRRGLQARSHPG